MSQVATKVSNGSDWEGIYVGDERVTEGHSTTMEDVFNSKSDLEVSEMNSRTVSLSSLGITSLPSSLDELENLIDFKETVVEDKSDWEDRIIDALEEGEEWPTAEEVQNRLDLTGGEFNVLNGVFTPDGVFDNTTAVGDEAIFSFVSTGSDEPTRYAPIDAPEAESYE